MNRTKPAADQRSELETDLACLPDWRRGGSSIMFWTCLS